MDCTICNNLMDDYFDGHLSHKKRKQVTGHLTTCQGCSEFFRKYENMLKSIRNVEIKKCPDEVVDSVFDIINIDDKFSRRKSVFDRINEFLFLYSRQLGIAGAAVTVFLFVFLITSQFDKTTHVQQQYTTQDVEQATDQVKLALAYFNQVTSRTEEIIEKEILHQQVVRPMKSSIRTALKPLINGG
ncbi:zf-HC2 domain-containing protein [candidate division KSB1 bacterium]|nr:zf-HC2 domain-containing protein [candidate division KSB1 bacterium]MBL7094087.1 zf-HC2 domain-containing protein [candidate division KSB1 bacterium]